MENVLFQTSLIAAFVAGVVALFAPCCITFLLPAYLGNVFKEKEKVLFMTAVFGLGIFVVLLPAVLGIAFISQSLFRYHDSIYIVGGAVMILVALTTFLGVKLPLPATPASWLAWRAGGPSLPSRNPQKTDALSIFTLGIFSGITSACCAPVLIGILTLTFLSPSFFGALLIGAMYVIGMVAPLLIISLFLSGRVEKLVILKRPIAVVALFGKSYPIIVGNLIAAVVFLATGVTALVLTLTGRLSASNMDGFTRIIQNAGNAVNQMVGDNLIINALFLLIVAYCIYWIAKKL